MPSIKCAECQKDISSYSKICIHCGFPINEIKERMEKYRKDRKEYLKINLEFQENTPFVIIHLFPEQTFLNEIELDLNDVLARDFSSSSMTLENYNSKGKYSRKPYNPEEKMEAFTQINRNGVIEVIETTYFETDRYKKKYFNFDKCFRDSVKYIKESRNLFLKNNLDTSMYITISFINVNNIPLFSYAYQKGFEPHDNNFAIESQALLSLFKFYDPTIKKFLPLKPLADRIWNVFGAKEINIHYYMKIIERFKLDSE